MAIKPPLAPLPERIPATVITGFLGAGKTSLIRHVVEGAGRRIALIINEFGEMGVDGSVLRGCGFADCPEDDIVELANGCICCTVAEDFLPTIEHLLARPIPPQHIIIETSGLALPKPLVRAFSWPEVRDRVIMSGVIAVIDAPAVANGSFVSDPAALSRQRDADPALDHRSSLAELFDDQISCADLVILNKTDLLDSDTITAVTKTVSHHLQSGTGIIKARNAHVDPRLILGLETTMNKDLDSAVPSSVHDHDHHHDHNDHDHDAFTSLRIPLPDIEDPADLANRISSAARSQNLFRVKGFAHVRGKAMRLVVQGVGDRVDHYFGAPWGQDEDKTGALVAIGPAGIDSQTLQRILTEPFD